MYKCFNFWGNLLILFLRHDDDGTLKSIKSIKVQNINVSILLGKLSIEPV